MIASEECLENVTHERPYFSSKIFDDSQLYSKSFSFIPVGSMTAKRALQIVGMKINLESQGTKDDLEMYKCKRIATNNFIPPTDKHKQINPASETSMRDDISADEISNCGVRRRENEEKSTETELQPILEMILSSVNDDTERLQLQLKSSCTEMEFPLKASNKKTETNTAKSQKAQNDAQSIKDCNDEELKHEKNVYSSNSNTAEILPSAISYPDVKEIDTDFQPRDSAAVNDAGQPSIKYQHIAIQTEGIINAPTSKEKAKKNSETAAILKSAVSSQTFTKCDDNAAQTEKASHYPINRFHDMATQTELSHTTKLSSFRIYDMSRNRVCDQSIQANGIKMASDDQSFDFKINGHMTPTFSEESTLRNSIPLFHIHDEMKVNERFCKMPHFEIRNDIVQLDKSNETTEKSKYLQKVLLKMKNNEDDLCDAKFKRTSTESAGKLKQADVVKAQVKSRINKAKSLNLLSSEKYVSIFDLNIKKPRKIIINPVNIICCSKDEHSRILSRKDKDDLVSLSSKTEKSSNVDLSNKNELSPQFVIINKCNSKASNAEIADQKEPLFHDGKKIATHCQCCNCSSRTQNLSKYAENSCTHGYKDLYQGYFSSQRTKSHTKVGNRNNSCKECRKHAYEISTRLLENLPNSHICDGLGDVTSIDLRMYENHRDSMDVFERFKELEMTTSEDKCIEL
ncbi:uncharacterized protein LOC118192403 [Stegodyphus dumicola]|uniref:uncharacterized protein LOC118192403 n=1 Tax=Stegodyphus dumicola TaxID=202533 RepID=UPI0015AAA25D|nr:uncharacterized protein LOC118192403 [Stegodyphus dumicola]